MPQSTRVMGQLTVFKLGSLDVVNMAKEATAEYYVDVAENMAINDLWHYPHPVSQGVRISATFAAEEGVTSAGLMTAGNSVAVKFHAGANEAGKGLNVTGTFLVARASYRPSKEGNDIQVELESRGDVTINDAVTSTS